MGYIRHHAIIVTGWDDALIIEAHTQAVRMFGQLVTPIISGLTNGYRTFFIAPDGSKEWWDTSDRHDELREQFVRILRKTEGYLEWAEVCHYDEEHQERVIRCTSHPEQQEATDG